jgi:N-acetylmuramoyl-L-alanine amidase
MCYLLLFLIIKSSLITYGERKEPVQVIERSGFTYIELNPISKLVSTNVSINQRSKRVFWRSKEHLVILILDNPFVQIDGSLLNFPIAPIVDGKTVFVPLYTVSYILENFFGLEIKETEQGWKIYDRKLRIKKIVIDPGHGGKDPGATGKRGLHEKTAVLYIGKLVKRYIEENTQIECVLTRDRDVFIPLEERTKLADSIHADLFISIHLNANRNRRTEGCEVYFLSPAKTNWARAVAARENQSLKFEGKVPSSEVESIFWDLAQNEYLKESNKLAGFLVRSIVEETGSKPRGVSQANFFVLRGAYMPAVLVEAEFLSNPKWEKRLKTDEFRRKISLGIYNGIREFISYYEKTVNK